MATSEQQKQTLQAVGIDLGAVDWNKVMQIIAALLSLFTQKQATFAKDTGCPDGDCATQMHEAICHNLHAAHNCLECCCAEGPYGKKGAKP